MTVFFPLRRRNSSNESGSKEKSRIRPARLPVDRFLKPAGAEPERKKPDVGIEVIIYPDRIHPTHPVSGFHKKYVYRSRGILETGVQNHLLIGLKYLFY